LRENFGSSSDDMVEIRVAGTADVITLWRGLSNAASLSPKRESLGGLKSEVQHLTACKVLRWKNKEQRTSNSGLRSA